MNTALNQDALETPNQSANTAPLASIHPLIIKILADALIAGNIKDDQAMDYAKTMMEGMAPKDAMEAMTCSQLIVAHLLGMKSMERVGQVIDYRGQDPYLQASFKWLQHFNKQTHLLMRYRQTKRKQQEQQEQQERKELKELKKQQAQPSAQTQQTPSTQTRSIPTQATSTQQAELRDAETIRLAQSIQMPDSDMIHGGIEGLNLMGSGL